MGTPEDIRQIEQLAVTLLSEGHDYLVIYLINDRIVPSLDPPDYADPGYVCRLNAKQCRAGLSWRIRQRLALRLAYLRQKGHLN
jgi:hypothetical protein